MIEIFDDYMMARVEDDSRVFEVNFDKVKVDDVTLSFHKNGERVGSIYNDDGTERLMARLETKGKEDFISTKVSKEFVKTILEQAEEKGFLTNGSSSPKAYKTRIGIKLEK